MQDPKIKTNPFENITADKYHKVKIEFIAHGNPNHPKELLSLPLAAMNAIKAKKALEEKKASAEKTLAAKNSTSPFSTLQLDSKPDITSSAPLPSDEEFRKTKLRPDNFIEMDEESGLTYDDINPQMLFDFFNDNPKSKDGKTKEFKFDWLTLFACTSVEFAKQLSEKMHTVIITAHEQKITIDKNGITHQQDGSLSKPHQFLNGAMDSPNLPI